MPTYEYACRECGAHLEVVQSFKDAALTTCPTCGGPLRKVFGAAGIIFKGSGYYVTDSRAQRKKAADGSGDGAPAKEAAASSAGDGAKAGGGSDGGGGSSTAGASSGGGSSSGSGSSGSGSSSAAASA